MNPATIQALGKAFGELIKLAGKANPTQTILIAQAQAALLMAGGSALTLAIIAAARRLDLHSPSTTEASKR